MAGPMTHVGVATGMFLVMLWLPSLAQEPPREQALTESIVIFNTVCARCHEAQCSGRLSFDSGYEAAVQHIIRHYAGAADKEWLQKDLFAILDYMKRECAFFPLPGPIPPQREWSTELLQRFGNLLQHDYFIPLGTLEAGDHQLHLAFGGVALATVQLVEASFDMILDERLPPGDTAVIPFRIERPAQVYFRLYTERPVALTHLAVKSGPNP